MAITLINNNTEYKMYSILENFIFSKDSDLREHIINIDFKELNPYSATYIALDLMGSDETVFWKNSDIDVDKIVLYTVLHAYIEQMGRDFEDYLSHIAEWSNFERVKSADIIASYFDSKTFCNFLRNLPYQQKKEWLLPIFRFGDDELIIEVTNKIISSYKSKMGYILKLLELSDTDQAIVLHDKIGYCLEPNNDDMLSLYTNPDMDNFDLDDDWDW